MTITTALCTSFKQELLEAIHDFNAAGGSTFKVALIKATPTGSYGAATTSYTDVTGNSDEVTGTGYTAGGETLTNIDPTTSGTTAYIDFPDVSWTGATFSADGCIVYNDSATGDPAVFVYDFGGTQVVASGTFTVEFPAAGATTAIVRIT